MKKIISCTHIPWQKLSSIYYIHYFILSILLIKLKESVMFELYRSYACTAFFVHTSIKYESLVRHALYVPFGYYASKVKKKTDYGFEQ